VADDGEIVVSSTLAPPDRNQLSLADTLRVPDWRMDIGRI
jgi:hypothetical protein